MTQLDWAGCVAAAAAAGLVSVKLVFCLFFFVCVCFLSLCLVVRVDWGSCRKRFFCLFVIAILVLIYSCDFLVSSITF